MVSTKATFACGALLIAGAAASGPFLTQIDGQTWVFGNDHWNVTEGPNYATKLYSSILPGEDLVGTAYGHYSDVGRSWPLHNL